MLSFSSQSASLFSTLAVWLAVKLTFRAVALSSEQTGELTVQKNMER